jgi:polyhydroxybutyrate depolymerase
MRRFATLSLFALFASALAACSHSSSTPSSSNAVTADAADAGILVNRPYTMVVPPSYDASKPTPFVFLFHGYGANGLLQDALFGMTSTAQAKGFLYAYADGTVDSAGKRFWNATDACCNFDDLPIDDVGYLDAILADVSSKYNVDPKRIYVIGHSNGGFMSHRYACDRSSRVAAIVSLAGAQWLDLTNCTPSGPVAVAEVHGDADQTILYDGGSTSEGTYPGAPTTVADWNTRNGCTGPLTDTGQTMDLVADIPGSETHVSAYGGCPPGIDVQLWTIQGGVHIPQFTHPQWGELVWGFLSTHSR